MAWTLAFAITQGINSQAFTLFDGSTGSDVSVVSRRVVCTLNDGTTLVNPGITTSYTPFPFSDGSTIVMYVLPIDYAMSITLQYVDVNGTVVDSLIDSASEATTVGNSINSSQFLLDLALPYTQDQNFFF